jgi:hypothetical protein
MLPRAILFDLDGTILSAYGRPELAWPVVITGFAAELEVVAPLRLGIHATWHDPVGQRLPPGQHGSTGPRHPPPDRAAAGRSVTAGET